MKVRLKRADNKSQMISQRSVSNRNLHSQSSDIPYDKKAQLPDIRDRNHNT